MFKNIAIGVLMATTAIVGFMGYQSSQKAVALGVLLDDKTRTISTLETDRNALIEKTVQLQTKIDEYALAEGIRLAAEAALNAATVNEADAKTFGESCRIWISQEFGDKDSPSSSLQATTISDSWTKKGMLVFEVATPSTTGSTSSMFLCIVDKAKGSMFKPSAFETSDWRRSN